MDDGYSLNDILKEITYDYIENLSIAFNAVGADYKATDQKTQEYIEEIGGREIGWWEQMAELEKYSLNNMFLVYAFSIFEAFISDMLTKLIYFKKELLHIKNGKTIKYEDILTARNMSDLINYMANEIVQEIKMNLRDLDIFFRSKFKINLADELANLSNADTIETGDLNYFYDYNKFKGKNCWKDLIEFQERRNIIVHNNSKVDKKYNDLTNSNKKIGDKIITSGQEIYQLFIQMTLIINEICTCFTNKFGSIT